MAAAVHARRDGTAARARPYSPSMKAAVVTRYGPPEVFAIRDVPAPVPRDHEVLVRVHASTVCFGDRMMRQGPLLVRLMNGLRRPKTTLLGADLAGTVVAAGTSVTRFAPGDAVFGSPGVTARMSRRCAVQRMPTS